MSFERVYTMTDFYDGPRRGVANYQGRPHFYDSEWQNDSSADDDAFLLTPISEALLELALEDWEIWRRWEVAFHEGRTDSASHPALPEDRARHTPLQPILAAQLVTAPEQAVRVRGVFRTVDVEPSYRGWRPLEVQWCRR